MDPDTILQAPATDKINLGGKDYSQEDVTRLVGLGEKYGLMAEDLETRWNTKLDRVYPEYVKASQELADIRRKEEAKQLEEVKAKTDAGEDISTEDQEKLVKQRLGEWGYLSKEDAKELVSNELAARDLLADVDEVIASAETEGLPKTSREELLTYMQETGFKNAQKAYKDMFEIQLDRLKEEKLKQMKPDGLVTTSTSTAGSKEPEKPVLTKDNLSNQLTEFFRARGQMR